MAAANFMRRHDKSSAVLSMGGRMWRMWIRPLSNAIYANERLLRHWYLSLVADGQLLCLPDAEWKAMVSIGEIVGGLPRHLDEGLNQGFVRPELVLQQSPIVYWA